MPAVADVNPDNDVADPGYGYQWWIPARGEGEPEIFMGNGYGGQFLQVVPAYDLVVVFNGWHHHERPPRSTASALQERILPAFR